MKEYLIFILVVALILALSGCKEKSSIEEKNIDLVQQIQSQQSHQIIRIDNVKDQDFAPDFTMETANGEPFTLSEHRGKVVVLNFWGLWCAPCLAETPEFIALQEELGKDNVIFVGVTTTADSLPEVKEYIEKVNLNYPIIRDDGKIADLYYPQGWPSTYLINKEGKISYLILGSTNRTLLKPVLEKLLS